MTDEIKERVRARLERIWKYNEGMFAGLDHQLIVMAVPTYPANIEAVSAMEIGDIADLLAAFSKEREKGNAKPVDVLEFATNPAFEQAREALIDYHRDIGSSTEPLGQGHDGGGPPQERAEPAAEAGEDQPSAGAVGDGVETRSRSPVIVKTGKESASSASHYS